MSYQLKFKKGYYVNALPKNFREADYICFNNHHNTIINEINIYTLHYALFLPEQLLFHPSKKPLLSRNIKNIRYLLHIFINTIRRTPIYLTGRYFLVTDDWSNGYYHWMTDVLQRLFLLKDELNTGYVLLPIFYSTNEYMMASVKLFTDRILFYENKNYLIKELVSPSHAGTSGIFNYQVINSLRDFLLNKLVVEYKLIETDEKIYISRAKATRRRIINETEVEKVLASFGFKILIMENLAWQEQINVMINASMLISCHGAGLTNMIFLKTEAKVLELRNENDHLNNCYYCLASALGFSYYYQMCNYDNPDAHLGNLMVDIEKLKTNITLMLS